jgi:UDP-N-acetylmuramoylalanine--D-glutamate ligase
MNLSGKKVAILGYGVVGKASLKYVISQKMLITLYDNNPHESFNPEDIKFLEDSNVELNLGAGTFSGLEDFDLIISSPGIDPKKEEIKKAVSSGVKLYTDITLFLEIWNGNGPVIGVTGSNGKSTTVSLIYESLKSAGRDARLGGNIGVSPLSWLIDNEDMMYGTYIVLELSSYALEYFRENHYVDILVFTSFSENHLSRHSDSIDEYASVKCKAIREGDTKVILSIDDIMIHKYIIPLVKGNKLLTVTLEQNILDSNHIYIEDNKLIYRDDNSKNNIIFPDSDKRKMKGLHNLYNISYTLGVLELLGVYAEDSIESLREYSGLPHRLQFVKEVEGVSYYNDSKSTSPDATIKALDTLGDNKNIVLIAGGVDKGVSYSSWSDYLNQFVKHLIILPGPAEDKLASLAEIIDVEKSVVSNMEEAIKLSKKLSSKGDTILLSPGAASLNLWKSFEERGEEFSNIVGWM